MMKKIRQLLGRIKEDYGFMGTTHSLLAVAIFLLLAALAPNFFFEKILLTNQLSIFIGSIFVVAGSALFNDIDNTKSTVISALGLFGELLSKLLRTVSLAIFKVTATKYDKKTSDGNPHRGFWHTFASSILVWLLVKGTTSIPIMITLFNREYTIGYLFALAWIYLCVRLTLMALFSRFNKKLNKNVATKIGTILFSLALIVAILGQSPEHFEFTWIANVITLGYLLHIMGDTLTKQGVPILWPIKFKNKRWWNFSFLKIEAGGEAERFILVPIFIILIVFSLFRLREQLF